MKCDSAANTADLLSTLSDKSRQQVELTINALCRSTRKAVRQAEKSNTPEAWQEVERRNATLCRLLDQLSPRKPETPAEPKTEPEPTQVPASVEAPQVEIEIIPATNEAEITPALEALAELEAQAQRVAALPRKNIGQVRQARREEAKLLARLREWQAATRS